MKTKTNNVIIFDLDGTIIDSSARMKFDNAGKEILEYTIRDATAMTMRDEDKILALKAVYDEAMLIEQTKVICITARGLGMREPTFEYLDKFGLKFDDFLDRGTFAGGDAVLKNALLEKYCLENPNTNFIAGFDDKLENLEVFKKYGMKAIDANIANNLILDGKYDDVIRYAFN
jgi:hypothetical protein